MAKPIPDADRTARELGATTVIGFQASLSRRYFQADAREILGVAGFGNGHSDMKIAAGQSPYGDHLIVIDETGVSPNNSLEQRSLLWKPCLELVDELDAPDAMVTPGLPFPFTAPQLAMFMLDGPGAFVNIKFGEWQSEPDQGALDSMGIYANRAREAVRAAFAAYHQAVGVVGLSHRVQEAEEAEALRLYEAADRAACVKHNPFRDAVTREEYWILLERAKAEVASQSNQLKLARSNSASARSLWRKAMVKELVRICLSGIAPDEPEEMLTAALPATTPGPAPVVAAKRNKKKPSIETVALDYMCAEFKQGQFQSASKFHKHLINTAGQDKSPFEMGKGTNARKLFCPAASSFYDVGTLSKIWAKIRAG